MSNTKRRPTPKPSAKRRPQARKGRTAAAAKRGRRATDRTSWIAALVIIAIGASLVVAFASNANKDKTHGTGALPASAHLVSAISTIPASVYTQVGAGTAQSLPTKLPGPPLLKGGKPRIVYIGSEYCPYCATERWALTAALARFGTFKNLKTSNSTPLDVYPNTNTLSYYKSTYTSQYITFEGIEQNTNIQQGSGWKPLDSTTPEQEALMTKWDAPPYVSASAVSTIPFIDFGNQWLLNGATFSPTVLQGKSHDDIAAAMRDPNSDIAKGAIGAANTMTAAICNITHDKPANVCSDATIQGIEKQLPTKVPK